MAGDGDVLRLNVGGTLFATRRHTLTQAENTYLSVRFNGTWQHDLEHDSEGRIFLDFDPYCVQQILSYLRQRAIDSNPVPYPVVAPDKQHAFNMLVQFLCLERYMGKSADPNQLRFVASHDDIALQLDGRRAVVAAATYACRSAVTQTLQELTAQDHAVAVSVEFRVTCNRFMSLGIACDVDTTKAGSQHHANANGFGWSSAQEQYSFGAWDKVSTLPEWRSGDHILLEVNFASGMMYMRHWRHGMPDFRSHPPLAVVVLPDVPKNYSFQAVLHSSGDAAEIVAVTADQVSDSSEWIFVDV